MTEQGSTNETRRPFAAKRRAVGASPEQLVKTGSLGEGSALPLLVEPAVEGVDLASWVAARREFFAAGLSERGGVLFRGFGVTTPAEFERAARAACGELLEYRYRSTPRARVSGDIYSSTEYPADEHIPLHNEMSYTTSWPLKIAFCCAQPADEGGETPVADSRRVYARVPARVREQFARGGVMYVRNYGRRLDLPWQDVFQTADRAEVEAYCRSASIEFEWRGDDGLRTRQVCQAVAAHPQTGEEVWFNQAHLFHTSNLRPEVREFLLASCREEDLPRNAYFGDGSPIAGSLLDEVREAYRLETVSFPWRRGDVLVLDNMLAAHGRTPFRGARQILVGMAEPHGAGGAGA
ncbi:MAG TPA: TauD/TfdA family dioxygenase [Pyrinomonadaceae bacterium]|jgi:alpha-ketoglutarate-dependent taurine dioxygenase